MPPRAPRLMLVTDAARTRWPPPELVAEAVAGGVDAVYLRDVDPAADELATLLGALRDRIGVLAGNTGTACQAPPACAMLLNGDPDRARQLGVGLHLRERDMSAAAARALLGPDTPIGKSVHTAEGAARAAGADYLLAGHVYPSPSKPGLPPLGLAGLRTIVAAAPCPVLAIGGITPDRVAGVVAAGAHGVAVIGAIAGAADPRAAAAALRSARNEALSTREKEAPMHQATGATSPESGIEVVVNGKPTTLPTRATIRDFLASKKMTDAMAIVERNGAIVPRAEYGTTALEGGDRLEVVHAVGGG